MTERSKETDFYNPQVLANLLVAFEAHWDIARDERGKVIEERNIKNINYNGYTINVDRHQAIGIASGVLALTANYLGYKTGFCRCFDQDRINNILKTKNNIDMLLGIGYPKNNESHTVHHIFNTLHVHPLRKTEIPIIKLP
jgi:nitroreductase